MSRTNQGGSIVSFLVIGVILTLLLIGGVYYARHNLLSGSQGSGEVSLDSNQDEANNEQSDDESTVSDNDSSEIEEGDSTTDTSNGNESQDNPDPVPVEIPSGMSDDSEELNEGADQPNAERLPDTGPTSGLVSALTLSILTATAVAYIRSR